MKSSVVLLISFCLTNLVLGEILILLIFFNDIRIDPGCTVTKFDQVPTALEICDDIILDNLEVPAGETLRLHLKAGTTVTFRGTTIFGYKQWLGPLVEINGTDVVIQGEEDSILDGQGPLYWDGLGNWGTPKPSFFHLFLHKSAMYNIHVLNNPVQCTMIYDSTNVIFDGWTIDASLGAKVSFELLLHCIYCLF